MDNKKVTYLQPTVRVYQTFGFGDLALAVVLGLFLICTFSITYLLFPLEILHVILFALIILLIYAIALFFLLEPQSIKEIKQTIIENTETPVFREVYIDRPVIREVIKEVRVPEYREVVKPIYIEKARKKLNIPRYKFLGSSQTKTYHLRTCRLSKLIKRKNKLSNNSKKYFIIKRFKACKVCISKKRKA